MDKSKISPDRLEVLRKQEEYERNGFFDKDLENDPPTIPLKPKDVDYLNKKLSSKIMTKIANFFGKKFYDSMITNKTVIFKGVEGLENLKDLNSGAIITSNHISIFDNYAIYLAFKEYYKKFRLYKIIREGNYNMPGKVGLFLKHSDTLPLSQNASTMLNFLRALDTLLKKEEINFNLS